MTEKRIPNDAWILRTRASMTYDYQALCNIRQVDRDRIRIGAGQTLDKEDRQRLDRAIELLDEAIDMLNAMFETGDQK